MVRSGRHTFTPEFETNSPSTLYPPPRHYSIGKGRPILPRSLDIYLVTLCVSGLLFASGQGPGLGLETQPKDGSTIPRASIDIAQPFGF